MGMAQRNAAVLARVGRSGMGLVQPADGLEALQSVLASSSTGQWAQVHRLSWRVVNFVVLTVAAVLRRFCPSVAPLQRRRLQALSVLTVYLKAWTPRLTFFRLSLLLPSSRMLLACRASGQLLR